MKRYNLEEIKPLTLMKAISRLQKMDRSKTKEQIMEEIQNTPIEEYRKMYNMVANSLLVTPTYDIAFEYLFNEERFLRELGNALTRVQIGGGMIRDVYVFSSATGTQARNDIIKTYKIPYAGDLNSLRGITAAVHRLDEEARAEVDELLALYFVPYDLSVMEFSLYGL